MQDSQIQAFLAIAETNSITKAAELLKIKPPSVSERITRLEQALGKVLNTNNAGEDTSGRNIKLFRNAGRRVELTEHGHIFLPFARIIEENWLRAKINIDKNRKFNSAIGIGIQFTLWDPIVPSVLSYMREEMSHVSPRFSAGKTEIIMDSLRNGQSEIVIAYEPLIDISMVKSYLFNEHLIMASTNPDTVLENIRDEFVFVDWGDKFHEEYWMAYQTYPHIQEPYAIFERTALALNVVRKSGGCGYFPYRFMKKDIQQESLHPVKNSYVFTREVYVVSRKDYGNMMRNTFNEKNVGIDDRHISGSGGRFNENNIESILRKVKSLGEQQKYENEKVDELINRYDLITFGRAK